MYWLRVPFSSSTGAAKAQVMKKAMMPEEEIMLKENDGKIKHKSWSWKHSKVVKDMIF